MTLTVNTIKTADEPHVDTFVAAWPNTLFYQRPAWRHLLRDLLDCEDCSLLVRDASGEIAGFLPLLAQPGPWGKVLNSLPFYGSHGGLLAAPGAARRALLAAYAGLVDDPQVASATMVDTPGLQLNEVPANLSDNRIGQITPIAHERLHADNLMASFHYKTRNAIRKAEKLGVQVRRDDRAFDFLAAIHEQNMAAIGGKPKPARFFDLVPQYYRVGEDYRIHVADLAGEPVAALLTFYSKQTVEYFTPVVGETARQSQALSLVIYRAMVEASQEGWKAWNWGGTWPSQEGVYRFKKRWGAQDHPYLYKIQLNEASVRSASRAQIEAAHPHFYVLPFSLLEAVA